jgi:RNA polymerase sigma-70 factor (ECF subfamily)
MKYSDDKWIKKAQEGSKHAFDKIIQNNIQSIFHLLYDMTGRYEDAQDLTQEAFLRAFLKIKQYNGKAKFSTWLYRIAYNIAIDFQRQKKRVPNGEGTIEYHDSLFKINTLPNDDSYSGENDIIKKALQTLTEPQRMTVILYYYHGFKTKEIGELLDCSEGTIRVHLFRALHNLRRELRQLSPKEES